MICGIGTDLVYIPRIKGAIERWGERFLTKVFTPSEIAYCKAYKSPEKSLAVRFAAKEACAKALGTGISNGISWRHISISRKESGKPVLELKDKAKTTAERLGAKTWHVSLSHEGDYALAVVILEGKG